ncbi:MAG TPA: lectin-like protein [Trichocoleus sp.]|jgi:hypothetical protein
MSLSNKDNSLRKASSTSLGRPISGVLGQQDKIDFYKFSLAQAGDFSLSSGKLKARSSAQVRLLGGNGQVLANFNAGTRARTITNRLAAGTYYISVSVKGRQSSNVRYRLTTATSTNTGGTGGTGEPSSPSPVLPDVISGPIVNPANGRSYYLLSPSNWTDAQAKAITLKGNLVTINDAAENSFVFSTFATAGGVNRHLWTGLYDADGVNNSLDQAQRRTEFVWVTGEPVTYSNWLLEEPNNPVVNDPAIPERYVHILSYGESWNNFTDNSILFNTPISGVVEVNS